MKKHFATNLIVVILILLMATPASAQDGRQGTPTVPDRPTTISAEEIAKELDAVRDMGHHDPDEPLRLMELFGRSKTVRGLNHLAFAAQAGLHHHPDRKALAERLYHAYNATAGGLAPTYTTGYEGAGECDIDFDNAAVLSSLITGEDPQALYTHPLWAEACGDGTLKVEPTVYDHTHMLFEDPTIDCIDLNSGHYGRDDTGSCVALADATQEARFLGTHTGREVLVIRLQSGGGNVPFSMHSFANVGAEAVKFRSKAGDGQWYQWNSMAGNTIWDVSAYVVNVTEVQITNAGTSFSCGVDWEAGGPGGCMIDYQAFFVDDFSIAP